MTEIEKLRALLAEARAVVAGTISAHGLMHRIDAALAEPVTHTTGGTYPWVVDDEARVAACAAEKALDEARAEVERLKADLDVVDSDLQLAVKRLTAEVERLRGAKPELPPRPPYSGGLPRYGLRWNGPVEPIAVPMDDGYWTPWHLAIGTQSDWFTEGFEAGKGEKREWSDAAFRRGAEAMREAALRVCEEPQMGTEADAIRALPVPEEK